MVFRDSIVIAPMASGKQQKLVSVFIEAISNYSFDYLRNYEV
jgi:hypothetical protein